MTHYINGEWLTGNASEFQSSNPATGETVWCGIAADPSQVNAAIAAAHAAFPAWRRTPYAERERLVITFSERVKAREYELAFLISQETGKVLWDAKSEAAATIGKAKFSIAAYAERTPQKSIELPGNRATLHHRPHGVMAVYGPYNFPAHL